MVWQGTGPGRFITQQIATGVTLALTPWESERRCRCEARAFARKQEDGAVRKTTLAIAAIASSAAFAACKRVGSSGGAGTAGGDVAAHYGFDSAASTSGVNAKGAPGAAATSILDSLSAPRTKLQPGVLPPTATAPGSSMVVPGAPHGLATPLGSATNPLPPETTFHVSPYGHTSALDSAKVPPTASPLTTGVTPNRVTTSPATTPTPMGSPQPGAPPPIKP